VSWPKTGLLSTSWLNTTGAEGLQADLIYLEAEDVLGLYSEIFGCSIEEASDQLRNRDALESSVTRPRTYAHYQNADIAMQAAVLAHGIAETQPFIEGNKRTALAAMITFLMINGFVVNASQEELAAWIIGLSKGLDADGLVRLLRPRLTPGEIGGWAEGDRVE
jgi:death-on-curing protein